MIVNVAVSPPEQKFDFIKNGNISFGSRVRENEISHSKAIWVPFSG